MASKTLDEIRRAEAEAINRQKMAQNSAEQALKKAKADAEAAQQKAVADAKMQAQQLRDAAVAECDAFFDENLKAAQGLCDGLAATADKNREKVVALVIDQITNGQS